MSNWKQHTSHNKGDQTLVGEKVECMEIIEQGADGQSLRLECQKCDTKFWFDDAKDGRNSVVRGTNEDGTPAIHAKCPKCKCEWDGNMPLPYYSIGFVQSPPSYIIKLAEMILGEDNPIANKKALLVFDCVQAENPIEAVKKMTVPKNMPIDLISDGIRVERVGKDFYEYIEKSKSDASTSDSIDMQDFFNNILKRNKSSKNESVGKAFSDLMKED